MRTASELEDEIGMIHQKEISRILQTKKMTQI